MTLHPQPKSYLSIINWPSGMSHQDRVEALVASAGMDPQLAVIAARTQPPMVAGVIDAIISDDILRVLHDLGVLALAPSEELIALYPEPEPIKRVARFPGTSPTAFAADDNDEPAWTFTSDDIRLIVSGTSRYIETRTNIERPTLGTGVHGRYNSEARVVRSERTRTKEMLDIHLVINGSPRLLRLTGQRTLIRSLDNIDSPPSLLNPPDPIDLLRPHVKGVRIDLGFATHSPPPKIRSRYSKGVNDTEKHTPEAFGFYSAWLATIDHALHGSK